MSKLWAETLGIYGAWDDLVRSESRKLKWYHNVQTIGHTYRPIGENRRNLKVCARTESEAIWFNQISDEYVKCVCSWYTRL